MMKRSREGDAATDDITTMANYLMLLSGGGGGEYHGRVFSCKTCNRQFSSFQALGGHRASHKKPRLAGDGHPVVHPPSPLKPKSHECSVCGMEFSIGQALGGHMRRHRTAAAADDHDGKGKEPSLPLVKKAANNSRRVLWVDLNLTPLENKFVFGNHIAPPVHCFF